jgi:hypothetical protein
VCADLGDYEDAMPTLPGLLNGENLLISVPFLQKHTCAITVLAQRRAQTTMHHSSTTQVARLPLAAQNNRLRNCSHVKDLLDSVDRGDRVQNQQTNVVSCEQYRKLPRQYMANLLGGVNLRMNVYVQL